MIDEVELELEIDTIYAEGQAARESKMDSKQLQDALDWIADPLSNPDWAHKVMVEAYREKCEERDRLRKIAQELYNALYYGEGKLEAFDLWEDYIK